jgi:hypothetical protein
VGVILGIGLWSFSDKAPFIQGLIWKDAAEVQKESPTPTVTKQVPLRDEPISPNAKEPIEESKADSGLAIEAIVWSSDGTGSFALINGIKLMAGDSIEGMTVEDIGRDYVVLRSEDGQSTVRLTLTLK